jgi:hypothetical protein
MRCSALPERIVSSLSDSRFGRGEGNVYKHQSRLRANERANLSLPFTLDGETYRVCLHCGARRRFVPASWRTVGAYYRDTTSTGSRRSGAD